MERRSHSDPNLASTTKKTRFDKINRSLRLKGEVNFQLNDTFNRQKYFENAKLEVIDNETDYELPPSYNSLPKDFPIKKFKSETDLKSIETSLITLEKLKIQHKNRKKRPKDQTKQGLYASFVQRLFGNILSVSCILPRKINFPSQNQQHISDKDLDLEEYLGGGAQGSVHKANYKNECVAVKLVQSKEDADIQHLMKLDHKNLVKFRGTSINVEKKFFAIVMEFCPNKSLYEFLNGQNLLKPSRIINMAQQITDGMNYLHEKKIIHRDLKSPNILLAENDILKITDFGACKDFSDEGTEKSFKGTVYWMAPELIRNENYSEKVDIYSFGVVFWELITCEKPYNNLDTKSVMFGVGRNTIRLQIPNFVPDGIKILLIQCFSKAKNRPSFKNISKHLQIFCQNEDISQLDKDFVENHASWKEDIRRSCRSFFNSVDPNELQDQIDKKALILKSLQEEELKISNAIEQKKEDYRNLFYRLQYISLELDEREENVINHEKKLNIQPSKRKIKPLLKQLFKNELPKTRISYQSNKSKVLWLDKCLNIQNLIIKNTDIFYYMNKYRRFKVSRNYGLNFYDCLHINPILKSSLDSKIFLGILCQMNQNEYYRLHFLNFKSRKLNKLNKNLPIYFKKKFKKRVNWFLFFQNEKNLFEFRKQKSSNSIPLL